MGVCEAHHHKTVLLDQFHHKPKGICGDGLLKLGAIYLPPECTF